MMKTGIIGGTFDPIHLGHLRIGEELLARCQLDRVIFIPAAIPPHKIDPQPLCFEQRLAMVQRAISSYPAFECSAIEAQRPGKSYSVDTLQVLHRHYPNDQFYFLIGMDSLHSLHTWYNYRQLFELCHLVVARRPGAESATANTVLPVAIRQQFCYDFQLKTFIHSSGHQLIFLDETFLDISSTRIRQRIANHQPVAHLLPAAVCEYIHAHHLYVRPER